MLPPNRRVTAAIFDLDGLLLDTEPLYLLATTELLARYGHALDPLVLRQQIGKPSPVVMAAIAAAYDIDVPAAQLHEEREAILAPLLPEAMPRPGALALTTALHEAGVPIGIGTSSSERTLALKIERHRPWAELFDCIVTRDDVEHAKPHPDIFLRTAERLGAPPGECVVFEDARSGVEAAQAAGMAVVVVPTDGVDLAGLRPDEVLDSLADFDPTRWQLV